MANNKVRIIWNGQGGELDSVTVAPNSNDDRSLTTALMELIRGQIVAPGDSFTVVEIDERKRKYDPVSRAAQAALAKEYK